MKPWPKHLADREPEQYELKSSNAATGSVANAGFALLGRDLKWHYDHTTMGANQTPGEMMQQIDCAFARLKITMQDHLVLPVHEQV